MVQIDDDWICSIVAQTLRARAKCQSKLLKTKGDNLVGHMFLCRTVTKQCLQCL